MTQSTPITMATLKDVAVAASVSPSTASRVLNGGSAVSPALEERVRSAAAALGYVSNSAAQALRGRPGAVAMLADDVGTEAVAEMAAALEAAAFEEGVIATVSAAGGDPQTQMDAFSALRELSPRALILTGRWTVAPATLRRLESELRDFSAEGGQVVQIGVGTLGYNSVGFDDRRVGVELGHHMAASGRRSAVILAGRAQHDAFRARTDGYIEGLRDGGVEDIRVIHSVVSREDGSAVLSVALDEFSPDMVLAANDRLALGALAELERRGLSVPQDVLVCGVDDIPLATDVTPTLTTASLPFEQAGRDAFRLAMRPPGCAITRVVLPGKVILRESTAH